MNELQMPVHQFLLNIIFLFQDYYFVYIATKRHMAVFAKPWPVDVSGKLTLLTNSSGTNKALIKDGIYVRNSFWIIVGLLLAGCYLVVVVWVILKVGLIAGSEMLDKAF